MRSFCLRRKVDVGSVASVGSMNDVSILLVFGVFSRHNLHHPDEPMGYLLRLQTLCYPSFIF